MFFLGSTPPVPDFLLHILDNALTQFLPEEIPSAALFFEPLKVLHFSLPLSKGKQGITRASDLFSFTFVSSRLDTLELQSRSLVHAALSTTHTAVASAINFAHAGIRDAYVELAASDGSLGALLRGHSLSTCHTSCGTRSHGFGRARSRCSEGTDSATILLQVYIRGAVLDRG